MRYNPRASLVPLVMIGLFGLFAGCAEEQPPVTESGWRTGDPRSVGVGGGGGGGGAPSAPAVPATPAQGGAETTAPGANAPALPVTTVGSVGGGSGVGTGRGTGEGIPGATGLGASGVGYGTGNIPYAAPGGLSGSGGSNVGTGRGSSGIPGAAGLGASGTGDPGVGTNGPSGNAAAAPTTPRPSPGAGGQTPPEIGLPNL